MQDIEFFDSHCHFDFVVFDRDRDVLWQQCQQQAITGLMMPGVSPEQWTTLQHLTEQYSGLIFAAGLHPWWIAQYRGDYTELMSALREASEHPRCVAIGECGLDAMIESPLDQQIDIFNMHLLVAAEQQLPLVVHCRKAHNELLRELNKTSLPAGGVIHAFTGSYEMACDYVSRGFYLGVGGSITYPRAQKTRDALARISLEYLVLETDAPDMPLSGYQGQRNTPLQLPAIAQSLAGLHGVSMQTVAAITTANARKLFFSRR